MNSKTILFIHGMCVNGECWNEWISYYQSRGFNCLAPSWPGHNKSVAELRRQHPDLELGKLTLKQVLVFYEHKLKEMHEQPVLIGHSMGGLLVQLLINKGYGACGIVIDSAPPAGVISFKWSFLKSLFPLIKLLHLNAPFMMSFENFQYSNVNTLPLNQQQELYNKFIVPESGKIPSGAVTVGKIYFSKPHVPLLFIAGANDHIIPVSLNKRNFERYHKSNSRTDFKVFAGRVHFIIAQNNWQEVADYILNWIAAIKK